MRGTLRNRLINASSGRYFQSGGHSARSSDRPPELKRRTGGPPCSCCESPSEHRVIGVVREARPAANAGHRVVTREQSPAVRPGRFLSCNPDRIRRACAPDPSDSRGLLLRLRLREEAPSSFIANRRIFRGRFISRDSTTSRPKKIATI